MNAIWKDELFYLYFLEDVDPDTITLSIDKQDEFEEETKPDDEEKEINTSEGNLDSQKTMEGNNCDQDQFDRNISNKTENSSSGIVQSREGGHHHHLGGQTTPVEVTVSQHVDQGGQAEAKSGESEDEKKEEEEKKESFNFPCSDIRYRLMKKETETALSLFIFSPLNNNVKNLMNKIDKR